MHGAAIKIPSVALDGLFVTLDSGLSYEANKNSVLSIGFVVSKWYLFIISNSLDCERFLSDSYERQSTHGVLISVI